MVWYGVVWMSFKCLYVLIFLQRLFNFISTNTFYRHVITICLTAMLLSNLYHLHLHQKTTFRSCYCYLSKYLFSSHYPPRFSISSSSLCSTLLFLYLVTILLPLPLTFHLPILLLMLVIAYSVSCNALN